MPIFLRHFCWNRATTSLQVVWSGLSCRSRAWQPPTRERRARRWLRRCAYALFGRRMNGSLKTPVCAWRLLWRSGRSDGRLISRSRSLCAHLVRRSRRSQRSRAACCRAQHLGLRFSQRRAVFRRSYSRLKARFGTLRVSRPTFAISSMACAARLSTAPMPTLRCFHRLSPRVTLTSRTVAGARFRCGSCSNVSRRRAWIVPFLSRTPRWLRGSALGLCRRFSLPHKRR